mmetsp:Transcript_20629/g.46488  ORF Transcript_20629/g.46488 Transcript_20629/m.46488 type:complete len:305 (-) Transcript_20629:425-1339(-)
MELVQVRIDVRAQAVKVVGDDDESGRPDREGFDARGAAREERVDLDQPPPREVEHLGGCDVRAEQLIIDAAHLAEPVGEEEVVLPAHLYVIPVRRAVGCDRLHLHDRARGQVPTIQYRLHVVRDAVVVERRKDVRRAVDLKRFEVAHVGVWREQGPEHLHADRWVFLDRRRNRGRVVVGDIITSRVDNLHGRLDPKRKPSPRVLGCLEFDDLRGAAERDVEQRSVRPECCATARVRNGKDQQKVVAHAVDRQICEVGQAAHRRDVCALEFDAGPVPPRHHGDEHGDGYEVPPDVRHRQNRLLDE